MTDFSPYVLKTTGIKVDEFDEIEILNKDGGTIVYGKLLSSINISPRSADLYCSKSLFAVFTFKSSCKALHMVRSKLAPFCLPLTISFSLPDTLSYLRKVILN